THDWHAAGGGALAYPRAHMALACGVVDGADRGGAAGSVELVASRVLAELCGGGGAVCCGAPGPQSERKKVSPCRAAAAERAGSARAGPGTADAAAVWPNLGGGPAGEPVGHTLGDVGGHATVHAGSTMAAFVAAGGIRGDGHDLAVGGHGSMAGGCAVLC